MTLCSKGRAHPNNTETHFKIVSFCQLSLSQRRHWLEEWTPNLMGVFAAALDFASYLVAELGELDGIAGLLGVLGFPVAALLLSVNLGRREAWRAPKKILLWLANLNWISVLLLVGTLVLMTIQVTKANGGHLPQHAPKQLPPGVLGLDGWADRLIILTNCLWVITAAWQAKNVDEERAK